MANAKKCDRCGEFYIPHCHDRDDFEFNVCERTQFEENGRAFLVYQKDLCDRCHADLIGFMSPHFVTTDMTWFGISYDKACDVLEKYVNGQLREVYNDQTD